MATVQLISGRIVERARLTDVKQVGDEGSRSAIAHIEGQTYPVYNSIIDGFNTLWVEQMDYETYKALGKKGFVEGSAQPLDE
ncbi:MAG: hypothetical protein H0V70_09940 [Ktedonobacteraceae bacterium]|nr:hypothetical protein [Ktedonobacteraceae bacterium]